ncbi:MAG: NAD+ synthase [Nitrososphaerales archaeon]|nr:NAD+ synthase [Nitrososphaerales archaeon]
MSVIQEIISLDYSRIIQQIQAYIRDRVINSKKSGVVLGLSGGLDSTVAAFLAKYALGKDRVLALIMPDRRITPAQDIEDAKEVADMLSIEYRIIDIEPIHRAFMENLEEDRLAEGNLRARIRMCLLYYHANLLNRLVMGTGDRSEILIGYFTKYGDGGIDFNPIGCLFKTQVRELARVIGVPERIINKKSSPRLWLDQTAEGEIGLTYEVIDSILYLVFDKGLAKEEVAKRIGVSLGDVTRVLKMYEETQHKRTPPDACYLRF